MPATPVQRSFEEITRLVEENIALAHFFARKWAWSVGEDDALSAALEALHKAAIEWDPARGKFGTFAALGIKFKLSAVRHRQKAVKRGGRATHVHIDAPLSEDGGTVHDILAAPAEDLEGQRDDRVRMLELVRKLDPRSSMIIVLRFGLDGSAPQTLEELGQRFKLTRERIRQIEAKALIKIQKMAGIDVSAWRIRGAGTIATNYSRLRKDNGGWDENPAPPKPVAAEVIEPPRSRGRIAGEFLARGGKLAEIDRLLRQGLGNREIHRACGAHTTTIARRRAYLVATNVLDQLKCPCGQPVGHRGWCSHRFERSPKRQAVMLRLWGARPAAA